MQSARVKNVCKGTLNAGSSDEQQKLFSRVEAIMKEGSVKSVLAKDPSKTERNRHKKAMEEYAKFRSPRYIKLITLKKLVKQLRHLAALYALKNKTPHAEAEIAEVLSVIDDNLPSKKKSEKAEDFEKRKSKFKPHGFKALLSGKPLVSIASVNEEIERLIRENKDLDVFLAKADLPKVRLSGNAADLLSHVAETVARSVVLAGAENSDKTSVVKGSDMLDLSGSVAEAFVRPTSARAVVAAREARRAAHDAAEARARETFAREKKLIKSSAKAQKAAPQKKEQLKFSFPSFNEEEVKAGHATVKPGYKEINSDGKEVEHYPKYKWAGIDTDDYDINFNASIESAIELVAPGRKFSKEARRLASRIVYDVCTTISEHCSDLINNVTFGKTVSAAVAWSVVKIMLLAGGVPTPAQKKWINDLYVDYVKEAVVATAAESTDAAPPAAAAPVDDYE
jgi:hypothetical protein